MQNNSYHIFDSDILKFVNQNSKVFQEEFLNEKFRQHIEQKYFKKDYFYSMSGTAYTWTPGNALVFDSNHIHFTGRMQSEQKLGISIRIAYK